MHYGEDVELRGQVTTDAFHCRYCDTVLDRGDVQGIRDEYDKALLAAEKALGVVRAPESEINHLRDALQRVTQARNFDQAKRIAREGLK